MFTAKEARKAAQLYTSPEKVLETIEKHIKAVSTHGAYELVHDCGTTDKETIMTVVANLRNAGYTVMVSSLTYGKIVVSW